MEAGRQEQILALLSSRGGRRTTARRALIAALVEATGHVTADDLAATIQERHPEVHRSTVYRTLEALERLGVVDHVHLGHGRAVYHLADEAHQHLVCEACGAVVEVPETMFAALTADLEAGYGFQIRPKHFAVPGRCRDCVTAPGS